MQVGRLRLPASFQQGAVHRGVVVAVVGPVDEDRPQVQRDPRSDPLVEAQPVVEMIPEKFALFTVQVAEPLPRFCFVFSGLVEDV